MIDVVLAFMIIVSFLVAMILHEAGHALFAAWLGDPTPRVEGRLSLALPAHVNALGTLLCVILAFFPVGSAVGLGWGNPVKADPWKLRGGPNFGTLVVAVGGIFTSLVVGGIIRGGAAFPARFALRQCRYRARTAIGGGLRKRQHLPGHLQPDPALPARRLPDRLYLAAEPARPSVSRDPLPMGPSLSWYSSSCCRSWANSSG